MKRFTTKEQIIRLIDAYAQDNIRLMWHIQDLENLANRLVGTIEYHRVAGIRDRADVAKKKMSWRETRLKNLGDKLSEFQTPMLPGVDDGDQSIPTS